MPASVHKISPLYHTAIVGIDSGSLFTGLAIAFAPNFMPSPLGTLIHNNNGHLCHIECNQSIMRFFQKLIVKRVVLGFLPKLNLHIRPLIPALIEKWGVNYENINFMDENFTNGVVTMQVAGFDEHSNAAHSILSMYLEQRGNYEREAIKSSASGKDLN
jgi:RNase H-fold protein (predicted Holliday junction resolvase)